MKRRVAVQTAPKKLEIVEEELPRLGPHDVLVHNVAIGLCHSDIPQYLGQSSMNGVDRFGRRFMNSPLKYPMYIGHEPVGIVEEVGTNIKNLKPGDYVGGSMGGFADYTITEERRCIPIPKTVEKMGPLKYCLPEPLTCITNIIQASNPQFGDYVAVIGCGMMGVLTIAGIRGCGAAEIIAIDMSEDRLELAKKYGATKCILATGDVDAEVYHLTRGHGCDVVIEITGSLKGLKTASQIVRYSEMFSYEGRGKIAIPSLYGMPETWDPETGYNLMYRSPIIHVTHPWYAMDYRACGITGVEAYCKGILPMNELITHEWKLEDIQAGFDMMASRDLRFIKGIITTD